MIEVYKHDVKAKLPTKAHKTDAGWDLYSLEDVEIPLGSTALIDTGISIEIPCNFVGKIEDRSSLAVRGLRTGAGVIDAGYSGRVKVVIHNFSDSSTSLLQQEEGFFTTCLGYKIKAGEKIAQVVIMPVDNTGIIETRYLWTSDRDNNGFGSSGS